MARQTTYSFLKKNAATGAKLSIILAIVSIAAMPLLFLLSFLGVGRGRTILGAIGLTAMLLAAYAFFLGLRALSRRDSRIRIAAVATILSGGVIIAWVALILAGVS